MRFPKFNYEQEWTAKFGELEKRLRENAGNRWSGHVRNQELWMLLARYKLTCFAERLRNEKVEMWDHPPHNALLHLYLINKHHWALDQARQICKEEDFLLVLRKELEELKLNDVESQPVKDSLSFRDGFEGLDQHFETA